MKYIFLTLCLFLGLSNYAAGDGFLINEYDVAKNLSQETKMPLLVIYSADYCAYCKLLKEEILLQSSIDNAIICILDLEDNQKLAKRMGVKKLPTSVLLDVNGKEISRKIGYNQKEYLIWLDKHEIKSR